MLFFMLGSLFSKHEADGWKRSAHSYDKWNSHHSAPVSWKEDTMLRCLDKWRHSPAKRKCNIFSFCLCLSFSIPFVHFRQYWQVYAGIHKRPLAVSGKLVRNCSVPSDKLLIIQQKSSYSFVILGSYWSYFETIYGEISTNTLPLQSLGSVRCKDTLNWSDVTLKIFMMLQKNSFKK